MPTSLGVIACDVGSFESIQFLLAHLPAEQRSAKDQDNNTPLALVIGGQRQRSEDEIIDVLRVRTLPQPAQRR